MGDASLVEALPQSVPASSGSSRFTMRYTDVRRDDEFTSEPPPRSLADYMPAVPERSVETVKGVETVKCPFCDGFEGDEAAVTHHIDREHLS